MLKKSKVWLRDIVFPTPFLFNITEPGKKRLTAENAENAEKSIMN